MDQEPHKGDHKQEYQGQRIQVKSKVDGKSGYAYPGPGYLSVKIQIVDPERKSRPTTIVTIAATPTLPARRLDTHNRDNLPPVRTRMRAPVKGKAGMSKVVLSFLLFCT